MWPFKRKPIETRNADHTLQMMAARQALIEGREGVAELTATVQGAVSLWEGGLSLADVDGTALLTPPLLAIIARTLALRGEFVGLLRDGRIIPAAEWDVKTRNTVPVAYRLSLAETGGAISETALAGEVVHFVTGSSANLPHTGTPPLRRAALSAAMLNAVEAALSEVYQSAPIGSAIIPLPEANIEDLSKVRADFRGKRGSVLIIEGTSQSVAAGQFPNMNQQPSDLTPQLSRLEVNPTLADAKDSLLNVFGVLPSLSNNAATGPVVREAQRHLAQWTLQPLAGIMAYELSNKLDATVTIDTLRPLQAFDAGGRARAAAQIVQLMAQAKESGVDADKALKLVGW